jgi:hypothetical protein
MKRTYHEILEYIYKNEEAGIREISALMIRKNNDHRDFYGLVSLLHGGYIGFTGSNLSDPYNQACQFQCYAQGNGTQSYKNVIILESENSDSYFYIGPKGIEYFHQKSETRTGWYLAAAFSLIASITSGVIVAKLTDDGKEKTIHCEIVPFKKP